MRAKEVTMGRFRIIIFIVLAVLIGVFAVSQVSSGGIVVSPKSDLQSVYYSNGGGMLGGFESRRLEIHEDGTGTLTTEYASWHGARTRTCIYEVDADLVTRMCELIDEYELWEASTRPDSELIAYDADTWHISLDFENEDFSFNENQELTKKDREGVSALLGLMSEMTAGGAISDTLSPRKVMMSFDGYTYTFLVNDSQAATDLCDLCPMDLTASLVDDEFVLPLPGVLDVSDCPESEGGRTGDLLYNPDTDELVIESESYDAKDGYYLLGEMEWPSVDRLLEAGGFDCYFYANDYEEMYE